MENRKQDEQRKPYEKPVVKRFPLRAEEAVLGFCKSPQAHGQTQGQCSVPSACSIPGS
jgi:hypothetical protein